MLLYFVLAIVAMSYFIFVMVEKNAAAGGSDGYTVIAGMKPAARPRPVLCLPATVHSPPVFAQLVADMGGNTRWARRSSCTSEMASSR